MSDVKIPISADVKSVQKGVEDIGKTIEKVSRTKWNPIDLDALKKDLAKAEQMMADFRRRTGGAGAGNLGTIPALPPTAPASAEVPDPTPSGMRGRRVRRGRGRYTVEPDILDIGRSFMGGVGGGFATIGGYATRGAYAGAQNGGMLGGGMGLLKGAGIGALAFGALKVGQGISEGYGMAKERAMTLDSLKRQMGDLGVSFEALKSASQGAAASFSVNSKESAKLMEEFSKLSRGADKTEEALMQSTITSGRTARAYGMDPQTSVQFFAGMRHIDPRQNNRELALLIAEASQRSGMTARVDEVMESMKTFFAMSTRMSLSSPNMNGYAGAYSDLVGAKIPGLTSEVASSMLGTANASMMRMGGNAGEAGMAFTLAAFQRHGGLNPIQAQALAEGGLFATRRRAFGPDSAIGKFMNWEKNPFANGKGADVSNFDAMNSYIKSFTGDKWMQMAMAKNLYGVNSLSQGAALLNLSGRQGGGLLKLLQGANIDINSVNESGLATLAKIGDADKSGLNAIFGSMVRRSGKGALTGDEQASLERAQASGDTESFRTALAGVAALKDQQETDATKLRDGLSKVEDATIRAGDKLIQPLNTMRDAMLVGLGYGEATLAKNVLKIRQKEADEITSGNLESIDRVYGAKEREALGASAGFIEGRNRITPLYPSENKAAAAKARTEKIEARDRAIQEGKLRSHYINEGYVPTDSENMTFMSPDAKHAQQHGHDASKVITINVDATSTVNAPNGESTVYPRKSTSQFPVPSSSGTHNAN